MLDKPENVAYSAEYAEHRKSFEWLFETEPIETETVVLGEGKYIVEKITYEQMKPRECDGILSRHSAIKAFVKKADGMLITEFKSIYSHFCVALIQHGSGNEYLIFHIDLYGYSIMDMQTHEIAHYVPSLSFNGKGETFIWRNPKYCAENDLLVADGCYWACPYGLEFYDFTYPMKLPLPMYCDSYKLEDKYSLSIDDDVSLLRFTDSGACILKCNDVSGRQIEKTIDIVAWTKEERNGTV